MHIIERRQKQYPRYLFWAWQPRDIAAPACAAAVRRPPSGCRLYAEVLWFEDQVSQRVAVEHRAERGEGLAEDAAQSAARRDQAPVLGGEALDEGEVGLGRTNHCPEPDSVRALAQRQASRSAAHRLEVSRPRQHVGDLHEMGARDTVD